MELFPFPTLTGSAWTINNAARMTFDGNDLSFLGSGSAATASITALGGGDTLAAALTTGTSYTVTFTITNYVANVGFTSFDVTLRGGTAGRLSITANGLASATVVAGASTAGLAAIRMVEQDGSLDTFKITDISVVAA